MNELYCNEF